MQTVSATNSKAIERSRPGATPLQPSFYFSLLYLIVEYARPQSSYDGLAGLPFGVIAFVCILVSFFLEGKKFITSSFQNTLLLLYLYWFLVSSIFAFNPDLAWQPLIDFLKTVIIYFLLTNIVTKQRELYIFLLLLLMINLKYAQFAVRIWISNGFYVDPRGLHEGGGIGSSFFQNPNDFGVAMNSVLGMSFYLIFYDTKKIFNWFKMRWFHLISIITFPLAVLATSSRGAGLGLGIAFLGVWYKSKRRVIGLVLLLIVASGYIALIPTDNWARFQRMGTEKDSTSQSRLELWKAGIRMANEYPFTGVGPNNYIYVNQNHYHLKLNHVQHNIFIQAMSELGYPGLILLIVMIIGCFINHKKVRQILNEKKMTNSVLYGLSHGLDICLIGFITNGFFITVLYYPFFWMILILSVSLLNIVKNEADRLDETYQY